MTVTGKTRLSSLDLSRVFSFFLDNIHDQLYQYEQAKKSQGKEKDIERRALKKQTYQKYDRAGYQTADRYCDKALPNFQRSAAGNQTARPDAC